MGVVTTTRWLSSSEQKTWRSFLEATRLLSDQLDHELHRGAGLSHSDYEVLVRLSEAEGRSMRMSDLAESSQSSRSRLSHTVTRLEQAGWIRRETCPSDRRGAFAVLTDRGFAVLEAAAPEHVDGVRRHLFDLLDRHQVDELGRISQAILHHLQSEAD
jgi:DNA-binding MarR family transcriptional regulator